MMLIPLTTRLQDDEVVSLLGQSVFPDPAAIEKAVALYRDDPHHELYGLEFEGALVGLAGIAMGRGEPGTLQLRHIAVHPDHRDKGFGRDMVVALIPMKQPERIVAETDDEAVDFYRNIGFTIESLGELYPGVERFACTYVTDEEEE
ncbi:GNAT family N-acetyltransferase [Paenibacillus hodogayensis]|uniref:GNAT family N-acetyltransferase n=1 Tax=Paenibacillus hodogayensis TaxID=279208 RepID=A0ABV5VRE6_9BACL